ncbi:hypothetical protein [Lutispora sp.]|uniref:hypothetical protein n=1 Tax=Lutispora sp. TaxID=2828727 RepID=UPI0035698851
MRGKGVLLTISLLALLLAGVLIFIALLGGDDKLEKQEPQTYKTLEEMKSIKIDKAFKRVVDKKDREVEIEIDESDLDELTALLVKEYEKNENPLKIRGYKAEIVGDKIRISIDSYLYKLIPAQYILRIAPSIENNRVSLFVESIKIGRFDISPEAVLKNLKEVEKGLYFIDLEKRSIVLNNKYPDQIILKSVEVDEKRISIKAALSINTLKDLVNVLGVIIPEELEALVSKVPVDDIKGIAESLIREVALSQISELSVSLKEEIVRNLADYAKNNIKLDKLNGILQKEKVDSLIKKAGKAINGDGKGQQDKMTALPDSIKKTLMDGVKKQLEKQDEDSKLNVLLKLFDNEGE